MVNSTKHGGMNQKNNFFIEKILKQVFSIKHAELSPALVFISKFLTTMIVSYRMLPFKRNVPYLDFLVDWGPDKVYNYTLYFAVLIGSVLILFSKKTRTGSFLIGTAFLWSVISCRSCLSVAHMYMSVTFIVISLSNKQTGGWLLKAQLIILYFGAGINKMMDQDWWNGNYFETLMIDRHANSFYSWAADLFEPKFLSKFMGIAAVFLEFIIPVCFLIKKFNKAGLIIGLIFHTILILLANDMFGPFYFTIVANYFIFLNWPQPMVVNNFNSLIAIKFSPLFPDIHFTHNKGGFFVKNNITQTVYKGYVGVIMLLTNLPVTFYLIIIGSSVFFNPVVWISLIHVLLIPLYWQILRSKK